MTPFQVFLILMVLMSSMVRSSPASPGNEVLRRTRRTIGPVSFGRINLIGSRFQLFPHPPLGVTNQVLFDVDVVVPRWLAFLIPGQKG